MTTFTRQKIFFFTKSILFGIVLTSCTEQNLNNKEIQVIEETFENHQHKRVSIYLNEQKPENKIKEIKYNKNGKIDFEREFENGKKHGKFFAFDANGIKWQEGYYLDDSIISYAINYYPSGQKKVERRFEKNHLVQAIYYYENGRISSIDFSEEKNGQDYTVNWYQWDTNGKLIYIDDKRLGFLKGFFRDGSKRVENLYDISGKIIKEKYWNVKGEEIIEEQYNVELDKEIEISKKK